MFRRLPPLTALRAFEAAARHGSFKQAADELAVTPTAISHQIRALEEYADLTLFERRTRKVVLTDPGAQLYLVLRDGFDAFAAAVERLTQRRSRAQVTISATMAFTARWLVPHVTALRTLHPHIDLQLLATDDVVDFDEANVDIAIRYGDGPYLGFEVVPMFADYFAPVSHPMLKVESVADLVQRPLIEFQWRRRQARNPTWARWFAAVGMTEPEEPPQLCYSDESHAIQAAVAGQGVALVSLALVKDELASGQLAQPSDRSIQGFRHHLLTRECETTAAVKTVAEWLLSETEALT
jgi:LysR family glycine cleavage system transcriptional activator